MGTQTPNPPLTHQHSKDSTKVMFFTAAQFQWYSRNHIRKNDHKTEEIQNELKELKKLLSPAEVNETEDDRTRRAVVSAVKETMEAMAGQMLGHQNHMDQQAPAVLRVGNYAVRQPSGAAALPRTNHGGVALTYQQ